MIYPLRVAQFKLKVDLKTYELRKQFQILVDEYFQIVDARSIEVTRTWSNEREVNISITLQNLHSDEEFGVVKYIHNTSKIVHVQFPVLDTFTEDLGESWLTTDSEIFNCMIYNSE